MKDSELMTVNLPLSLGVTRRTLFRWMSKIKNWPVPVSPVGARVKFIRSEIMEFYKNKGARQQ
ncbi:hypothetical protein SK85_01362 [Escherichia coli]|jgi:predicted DNA-binding transcriptional regulator AlpA|nr:hypothetical protein [Escherichia coli]EQO95424.1 hypothetical protein G725_03567 [Escherichia coli HVH 53 (4-0631051)]EQT63262.1 hypothetical protein G839_01806 [Escherichia coli HVH 187 (4-4471660)]EQW95387.1 hypothetical protein G914_01372 [Escherichia coli UMEA 3139-1]ERA42413.1 hypothetical protein H000_00952 [Escherichia coli UMEA 3899-1]KLX99573.1 hypothetical protein SK85_01362 [Escherichia coli]